MADALSLLDDYNAKVEGAAQQAGIRPELLHAVIDQESQGNPNAVSPKGAVGVGQVLPSTGRDPGFGVAPFNPTNPDENIKGSAAYLGALVKRYGDESKGLAAYNWGPGTVDKGGTPPPETQAYVPAVLAKADKYASLAAQSAPQPSALDLLDQYEQKQQAPPSPPPQKAEEKSLAGFGSNVLSSAGNLAGNLYRAATDIPGTAKALANTAMGVGEKFLPGQHEHEKYADALGQMIKSRYGSWDNIKNTLYTDPVGALADVASVAAPVEGVADLAGLSKVARVAELAGNLDPLAAVGKGLSATIGRGVDKTAEGMMSSVAKIPKSIKKANPTVNIPRVMLDEGLNATEGGLTKADNLVEGLSGQVSKLADNRPTSLQPVMDAIDQKIEQLRHQPNAEADIAALTNARDEMLRNNLYGKDQMGLVPSTQQVPTAAVGANGQPITQSQSVMVPGVVGRELRTDVPASEVNTAKQNVYAGLKGKYGVEKGSVIEADKTLGRGFKQSLDQAVPEIAPINQRQSGIITARNALRETKMRVENKYPLSLYDEITGMAALATPHAIPAFIASLLTTHQLPMSLAARAVDKGSKVAGSVNQLAQKVALPLAQADKYAARPIAMTEAQRLYPQYLDSQR